MTSTASFLKRRSIKRLLVAYTILRKTTACFLYWKLAVVYFYTHIALDFKSDKMVKIWLFNFDYISKGTHFKRIRK